MFKIRYHYHTFSPTDWSRFISIFFVYFNTMWRMIFFNPNWFLALLTQIVWKLTSYWHICIRRISKSLYRKENLTFQSIWSEMRLLIYNKTLKMIKIAKRIIPIPKTFIIKIAKSEYSTSELVLKMSWSSKNQTG